VIRSGRHLAERASGLPLSASTTPPVAL